jgi:SAM-dependent methyltransferase
MNQFRRPTDSQGRAVAALMNTEHWALTTWGLTHVDVAADAVILDVGCGGGKTINRLAQLAPQGKVYGIDYSTDMVKYSKEVNELLIKEKRVEIFESTVEKLSFPDNFFDLVTAIETYYFWPSLPDAFSEIKRVLKPNGKLLIVNEVVKDGIYEIKHAKMIKEAHLRLFTLEEIRSILRVAGFVDVQVFTKANTGWNTIRAQKPYASNEV